MFKYGKMKTYFAQDLGKTLFLSEIVFIFLFLSSILSIDASREDGSFGRLVNDEHRHPNCRMKKIEVEGKPHLCLFALKDIKDGEEITYDYGGGDCPWRMQVCQKTEQYIYV